MDDHQANVSAAREVGLTGELYHLDQGMPAFLSILERNELLVR